MKKISGFTSKNNQIKLLVEIKNELLQMTSYNYISKKTIDNLFEYLLINIDSDDYVYLKKVINILVHIYSGIERRMLQFESEKDAKLEECHIYILNKIEMYENELANRLNKKNYKELEKTILFEKIIYTVLEKRDLKKSIQVINDNIDILNYYNYEGKDFECLLFEKYIYSKIINDSSSLIYYTSIIKHIMFIYKIKFDRRKFSEIINDNKTNNIQTNLSKKLKSLKFDPIDKRFILNKEIIASIDSRGTKNIDDALSVERLDNDGFILGIHIADVCSLTNFREKILTNDISNYSLASLDQKKRKNAISLFVEIDKNGIIKDYKIIKSNIHIYKNLFDTDVKDIIKKDRNNKITKFIMDLRSLYLVVGNSKLDPNPPNYKIGKLIVEKFMILFGCIMSKYFDENNLPYIYLNNKDGITRHSLYESEYETGFEDQGLYTYGRATSPIIDFTSRVNQVLLYEYYLNYNDDKKIYKLEDNLNDIVRKLNNKRRK